MKQLVSLCSVLLIIISLSSCGLFSASEPAVHRLAEYSINTSSGISQGQSFTKPGSVINWFDIPYAQPPVGDLRWRAPRSLNTPKNTIVDKPVTSCVQEASSYGGLAGEGIVGTEDCLYLDIRAPSDFSDKNYPVMFWIHGGGNKNGHKDYYNYSNLVANKNVIVVSINYRLGALGWFTHPAIQGLQEGLDKTSNFGSLDIIEALKWVQSNIAEFGGNPDNVTIFGESAGAHNVYTMLATPLSKGLFHKAIAQSGYTISNSLENAYNHQDKNAYVTQGSWRMVEDFLAAQDQDAEGTATSQATTTPEQLHTILKDVSPESLMAMYIDKPGVINYQPLTTIDGIVIPAEGLASALGNPLHAKDVPVISGSNKDEVSLWLGLHRYFMETSYPFTKLLPPVVSVKDPQLYNFWVRLRSQAWKARGVDEPFDALEQAGYKTLFAYRFDWDHQASSFFIDFPNIIGAAHGTDISFVSGDYKFGPISSYIYPEGEARDQMNRTFMNIWGDFATSGKPDKSLDFEWQAYNSSSKAYVRLDKDDLLGLDFETETLDTLLAKIAGDTHADSIEKCIMVWETLINIGDRDIQRYKSWNNKQCVNFDARKAQENIAVEIIKEFGSTSVI
ncbi:MAG: para-nitrobenzyl esterase [Paraglaciecola sp.]|jgi:para-nitrobenzyl esterase